MNEDVPELEPYDERELDDIFNDLEGGDGE
jgi:hypothetical protein